MSNEKLKCPCGSLLDKKGINRHNKTKKHIYYIETGLIKFTDSNEYQRKRFDKNLELRQKQRTMCKDYYEKNKDKIHQRHQQNREYRKKVKEETEKKFCKCCKTVLSTITNQVI